MISRGLNTNCVHLKVNMLWSLRVGPVSKEANKLYSSGCSCTRDNVTLIIIEFQSTFAFKHHDDIYLLVMRK